MIKINNRRAKRERNCGSVYHVISSECVFSITKPQPKENTANINKITVCASIRECEISI